MGFQHSHLISVLSEKGGRDGGREGGRKGGREEGRKGGREIVGGGPNKH